MQFAYWQMFGSSLKIVSNLRFLDAGVLTNDTKTSQDCAQSFALRTSLGTFLLVVVRGYCLPLINASAVAMSPA